MSFQVFIERPRDPSPIGAAQVSAAIAERFGLPTDVIAQRMSAGRFRVKTGVDRDTAERFAAELEDLGAVVSVVDESGNPVERARAPETAAPAAATGPSHDTGLSAALANASDEGQELGALESARSDSFALATLDGDDDAPPAAAAAPQPQAGAPVGDDAFRPPDEQEEIEVALDTAAAPPPPAARPAPPPQEELLNLLPDGTPAAGASEPEPGPGPLAALARNRGTRTAVGALLVVLLGFLPAHLAGALRSGAYDTPRKTVEQAHDDYRQTLVANRAELAELDATLERQRDDQRAIMKETQTSIALTAGVVWLLVSAGLGFLWFRKIDWTRWA